MIHQYGGSDGRLAPISHPQAESSRIFCAWHIVRAHILGESVAMAPSDYASAGSGKLKLKGVKDSKVDKKKKKKSSSKPKDEVGAGDGDDSFQDRSVMLKNLEDEDAQVAEEENSKASVAHGKEVESAAGQADEEGREIVKTETERKYEEQRRKRVRGIYHGL